MVVTSIAVEGDGTSEEGSKHYNDWPNDYGFEISKEERTPVELLVTGNIPDYIAGTLYRTGPGGYKTETNDGSTWAASHWFDGFTQVHRFQIFPASETSPKSRVLYNSRHSVDGLIEHIRQTGDLAQFTFGQKIDPCKSYFKKLMGAFAPLQNVMTGKPDSWNLGVTLSVNMPGLESPQSATNLNDSPNKSSTTSLLNKTDNSSYQFIDPSTLEPIGLAQQSNLHPDLTGPCSATHAKQDPFTGDIFNYNLEIGSKAIYRVFHVSASTGKTDILATITDAPSAYLHSLFLTPNHVILCVWGAHFSLHGLSLLYNRNILDSLLPVDPTKPCRWYVISRSTPSPGVLATYTTPPFFSFHTINAYEIPSPTDPSETDIIADISAYDDLSVLKRFFYDNLKSSSPDALAYTTSKGDSARAWLGRYRLPNIPTTPDQNPTSMSTARQAMQEFKVPKSESMELPTLNPNFVTRKHRYIYGVTDRGNSTFFDGLMKYDTQMRTPLFWQQKGQSAGEAIFVPDPEAEGEGESEDKGVLLSVVLDGYKNRSYLLVLNAQNMKEVGRAEMERAVGFGFHGVHVASQGKGKVKGLGF